MAKISPCLPTFRRVALSWIPKCLLGSSFSWKLKIFTSLQCRNLTAVAAYHCQSTASLIWNSTLHLSTPLKYFLLWTRQTCGFLLMSSKPLNLFAKQDPTNFMPVSSISPGDYTTWHLLNVSEGFTERNICFSPDFFSCVVSLNPGLKILAAICESRQSTTCWLTQIHMKVYLCITSSPGRSF